MFKLFRLSLPVLAVWVGLVLLGGTGAVLTAGSGAVKQTEELFPNLRVEREEEQIPLQEKIVYLTFDDGPSKNTKELRRVLNKYGVKATFFVTHERPEQVGEMAELAREGHTVAPHAYTHDYGKIYSWLEGYLEDFEQIFTLVKEQTGNTPKIFRFPGGSRNANANPYVLADIVKEMEGRGFTYFDWNVVSGDDTAVVYPPETLAENVFRQQGEKPCLVVLFHDTDLSSTTPQAVELVIQHYLAEGWNFLPLTGYTQPMQFPKTAL